VSRLQQIRLRVGEFTVAAPVWAQYVARNRYGVWFAFSHMPVRAVTPGHWSPTTGRCVTIASKYLPAPTPAPWHTHLYTTVLNETHQFYGLAKIPEEKR
jgi:hypothetical protein